MAEKEAALDSEDQDLNSIQTLLRQHEALEVGNILQETQEQEGQKTKEKKMLAKNWNFSSFSFKLKVKYEIYNMNILANSCSVRLI